MALSLEPPADAELPVAHVDAPPPGSELPVHYVECFGCGDGNAAGLHLRAAVGAGVSVLARFTVHRQHQGAPGLAHGGLLATAMDESLGFVNFLLRRPAVTARLEIDYRLPVPVGTELAVRAECVAVAGRKTWMRGAASLPDGRVAVGAAALFLAVPVSHFTRHGDPEAFARTRLGSRDYNP